MADIELKRTHHLGLKGARAAAEKMAEKLGKQFNLSGEWTGNTLHFDRPGVNGKLTVTDHDMHLAVTLGFLLKAMKGPIEKAVHDQLDKVLDEAPAPKAAKAPAAKAAPKATAKAAPKATAKTAAKPAAKKK
ncbi:MAG: polyhydroxyalkanoic acid system family protein [Burkholderiales bacterium]|nr:polyhydroxyalkanoic acid system family protein [Burkholderiales bacterium]